MPPPTTPAGASGPGSFSQRTDGGPAAAASAASQPLRNLPNAKYGENKTFQNLQKSAPLSQAQQAPSRAAQIPNAPQQGGGPGMMIPQGGMPTFSAPTQRPNEPVTAGALLGPGPGPEALGINPAQFEAADMQGLAKNLPVYEYLANLPDAMPSARLFVNLIKTAS